MDVYIGTYVILEVRKGGLQWLGHVKRMPEEVNVRKAFKNIPEIKLSTGKPGKR
jgi:hypothetical protein